MKSFSLFVLGAGLVSAANVPTPIAASGGDIDPNALLNSSAVNVGSSGSSVGSVDPNSALNLGGSSDVNLGSLNVGGLDLGSVDLSSQSAVVNAIELMMSALCLGDLVSAAVIEQLSQEQDLEMFLELAELMQLEEANLINVAEIQTLFSAGSLFSSFDIGVLKRGIAAHKKAMPRRLRRGVRPAKRQSCPAVGSNVSAAPAAVSAAPAVAASAAPAVVSAAPAVATDAAPAAAADPAAAAAPAAAAPAAAASSDSEPLSDFTR